jgi:hypothetical protein
MDQRESASRRPEILVGGARTCPGSSVGVARRKEEAQTQQSPTIQSACRPPLANGRRPLTRQPPPSGEKGLPAPGPGYPSRYQWDICQRVPLHVLIATPPSLLETAWAPFRATTGTTTPC